MGRPGQALDLARRGRALAPAHPDPAELLSDAFLALDQPDSALAVARAALAASPVTLRALENYQRVLERTQAPAWQRQLAAARVDDGLGRLVAASARLDSVSAASERWRASPGDCWEIERSLPVMRTLSPTLARQAQGHVQTACRTSVR
jgi:hypothetical protein